MSSQLPLGDGRTIAERLAASGTGFDGNRRDFDILNTALGATGLTAALEAAGADVTLLAPTDGAFLKLAASLGYTGHDEAEATAAILTALGGLAPDGDPIPLLRDILLYHVVPDALTRAEIAASTTLPTLLEGATLRPFGSTIGDADPDARDPSVVRPTIQASNGTIQAIDEVLLPIDVPGNSDDLPPLPSIADIVARSGEGFDGNGQDFDLLRAALEATGLTGALDDDAAALTLFAPTDAAFVQLARTLGYEGSSEAGALDAILGALGGLAPGGDAIPLLRDILLYHVAEGRLSQAQADAAGPIGTLAGGTIRVDGNRVVDAEPDLRDARFLPGRGDIEASNGAVQAIDRVLLPLDLDVAGPAAGSIADQVNASGRRFDRNGEDFDILKAAVKAAGLGEALDDPAADLTLFAPTDDAFVRLARDLGYDRGAEAGAFDAIVAALTTLAPDGNPVPLLQQILLYHVADGARSAQEIRASVSIETLQGGAIAPFGRSLGDFDLSLPDAKLILRRADLDASNGVIQAIDRVLLPFEIEEARGGRDPHGTLADLVAQSGEGFDGFGRDFDILKASLDAAGLTGALDNPEARLTLLAPTDDAFVRLARDLGYGGTDEAGAFGAIVEALTGLGGGDPIPLLGDILSYHVLDGRFGRAQLDAAGQAETLLGATLGFEGARITDAEPGYEVRFVRGGSDVEASNGALQAIDGVLLPLNLEVL